MTVRELIVLLQAVPPDFPVLYRCRSDYSILDGFKIEVQRETDELKYATAVNHHNMPGEFRFYLGEWEYEGQPLPKPVNAVIFPGN